MTTNGHRGYTRALAHEEPAASVRKSRGFVVLDELRFEELLARYMPEDARDRTLGA